MKKNIEQIWNEDKNKCFHAIVKEARAESLCEGKDCEGYGVYLEGDDVLCCKYYTRVNLIKMQEGRG
jgi:hypothetical protein